MRQVRDLVETILIERDRYGAAEAEAQARAWQRGRLRNEAAGPEALAAEDHCRKPPTSPYGWPKPPGAAGPALRGRPARTRLIEAVTSGQWTHDYPITAGHARELGLPING